MIYFEEGTLPNGQKADLCVVEHGAGNVGKFPADALTSDGKTTYRERFAEAYDRYKRGDQDQSDVDEAKQREEAHKAEVEAAQKAEAERKAAEQNPANANQPAV